MLFALVLALALASPASSAPLDDLGVTAVVDQVNGQVDDLREQFDTQLEGLLAETAAQQAALEAQVDDLRDQLEATLPGTSRDDINELIQSSGLSQALNDLSNSVPLADLLGPLQELLCPVAAALHEVGQAVPPLDQVTSLLVALLCNIDRLSYSFHTVWEAPGGELVKRNHQAVVGVPTALDVDNRPGTDFTGTIDFALTLDTLNLKINRSGSEANADALGASIEAVIEDPTGSAGKERIAFGYDQLGDRAPRRFETQIGIPGLLGAGGDPVLDVDITQTNPGADTNIIGSFFDGPPEARQNLTEFRLEYANSPTVAGMLLTLADPLTAQLTTNVTGPVVAKLSDNEGAESFNARASIEDMPPVFNLEVGLENPRIVYTGDDGAGNPQGIEHLNLNVDSTSPIFARADTLRATIDGLPSNTQITVDQDGSQLGLVASQPIDSIEVVGGSEAEQPGDLPPAGIQGAHYFDRASEPFVLGARILELEQLTANLGDEIGISASTAGGPFDLLAKVEGLEVDAAIRDLPEDLNLTFDSATGSLGYSGSSGINDIDLDLISAEPLIAEATIVNLNLEDVPNAFTLGLAPGGNGLQFDSDNPLGLIEAKAKSPGATDESALIGASDSGAVLRDVGSEFFLFTRLFGLSELGVGLDPITLHSRMDAGRIFTIDAQTEQDGGGVIDLEGTIDKLPSVFDLGLAQSAGTELSLESNEKIDLLRLSANGLELLDGADDVEVAIHDIPTDVSVLLPETGPLADIDANDEIGQLRLAAAAGSATLPERSIAGDPVLNDLFGFRNLPGDIAIGVRLSAMSGMAVNLDPINISLDQDNALTRPITLDAAIDSDGNTVNVDGLLDKPGDTTSMSVDLTPGQPTRLLFDDSHNMDNFDLVATGLPGVDNLNAQFDNLSKKMAICMAPNGSCQRTNPNPISGQSSQNGRPYPAAVSLDFDDQGTHGSGTGAAFRTTLNATVDLTGADPVQVTNLRFRNIAMDFGTGSNFSGTCTVGQSVPRMYMFFASRSHPFVMNSIKYPPLVQDFRIGTDTNPARAATRIAMLGGCTGFLNGSLSTAARPAGWAAAASRC